MVRVLGVAAQGAIRNPSAIMPVDFVYILCRDAYAAGYWGYPETVATNVIDGETGATVSRTFDGDGALLQVDPIPMRIGLEVRTISVVLSQIHPGVQTLVRGHDTRNAKVQIYRGFFDPATFLLVEEPRRRWLGQVNHAPIATPSVGDEGSIALDVVSHTRELTRVNTAMKSDETQKLRSGDRFRRYSGVAATWPFWWGEEKGKAD